MQLIIVKSMRFPVQERKEYTNNTLFEVVFQARFPQIVKISTEEPANFQDIIRRHGFPETSFGTADLPSNIPEPIRRLIKSEKDYNFLSEDGNWRATITKDFIALSCMNYKKYTEFKERLETILKVFHDQYEPSYYSRIGFRYQNICNAHMLHGFSGDVSSFIPEHIAPELKQEIGEDLTLFEKKMQFTDPAEEIDANLHYAYGKFSGKFGKINVNEEKSYIIDIDCFSKRRETDVNTVISRTQLFNERIRNIFQWSITDDLCNAMGPK